MTNKETRKSTPFAALTKRKVTSAVGFGLATGLLLVSGPALPDSNKGQEKVTICHKGKEIDVALPALVAHLLHGDRIGSCDDPPPAVRAL